MLYHIEYDTDQEPTVHRAFTRKENAVPWEVVQHELQEHFMRHGSPIDVLYWSEVMPDEYFKVEQ